MSETESRSVETPPDDPAGFRASWEALGAPRRVLLAVSGGSDSMALMHLAAPLARDGAAVAVATVDHGLRTGSPAEAEMVAVDARRIGLPHATLQWTGTKPKTGLQEAARAARYYLLAAHANTIGATAILTAHTADDQAETVMMRLARGSGARGLAGMAAATLIAAEASAPVMLLRPLLRWRRAALRRYLARIDAPFADDPSNEDVAYERIRIRRRLETAADEISVDALNESAESCRRTIARLESAEDARFLDLDGAFDACGGVRLRAAGLTPSDASLIARLAHAVSGADHFPKEVAAETALGSVLGGQCATIGGTFLQVIRERLCIVREAAALLGRSGSRPVEPQVIRPGERVLWDRRFIVANDFDRAVEILPLGGGAAAYAATNEEALSLASAPALWLGGRIFEIAGDSEALRPLADERFYRRVNRFIRIT